MLIGNKCDLDAERVVSTQDGERLAKVSSRFQRTYSDFYRCVVSLFTQLAALVYE